MPPSADISSPRARSSERRAVRIDKARPRLSCALSRPLSSGLRYQSAACLKSLGTPLPARYIMPHAVLRIGAAAIRGLAVPLGRFLIVLREAQPAFVEHQRRRPRPADCSSPTRPTDRAAWLPCNPSGRLRRRDIGWLESTMANELPLATAISNHFAASLKICETPSAFAYITPRLYCALSSPAVCARGGKQLGRGLVVALLEGEGMHRPRRRQCRLLSRRHHHRDHHAPNAHASKVPRSSLEAQN